MDEEPDALKSEDESGPPAPRARAFGIPSEDEDDDMWGAGAPEAAAPAGDAPGASSDVPTGALAPWTSACSRSKAFQW